MSDRDPMTSNDKPTRYGRTNDTIHRYDCRYTKMEWTFAAGMSAVYLASVFKGAQWLHPCGHCKPDKFGGSV